MSITRKRFLQGMGAMSLAGLPSAAADPATVGSGGSLDLVQGKLPTSDEISQWTHFLADCCPTFTGGPGHTRFVNFLDQKIREANLKPQRKTFKLPYWELKDYGVKLGAEKIQSTGYRPLSGPTPPEGITAPMYYAGSSPKIDLSGAKGKILLIDVPYASLDWLRGPKASAPTLPRNTIRFVSPKKTPGLPVESPT